MQIDLASGHAALADDADMELLLRYSWYLHRGSGGRLYAAARLKGDGPPYKRVKMHRLIVNAPDDLIVHHINNDGLDNRRSNLEVTTNRQNIRSMPTAGRQAMNEFAHPELGGGVFCGGVAIGPAQGENNEGSERCKALRRPILAGPKARSLGRLGYIPVGALQEMAEAKPAGQGRFARDRIVLC